jgi:TPR repeat protein
MPRPSQNPSRRSKSQAIQPARLVPGRTLRAAGKGDAQAKYNLGVMYQNGWGVQASLAEARQWYSAAAAQGSADGRRALALAAGGSRHRNNTGIPFGSMLCNKMLGTSSFNVFSPCN